jgi:hypothetical protein
VFGDLKGEMPGFTANSRADILSEINRIFQEISKETFVAVYDEWITEHKRVQSPGGKETRYALK